MSSLGDAGVVDEHVDAAHGRDRVGGQAVDLRGIGEVAHPAVHVVAVGPTASGDLLEAVGASGADADGGTGGGERLGQSGTDPR